MLCPCRNSTILVPVVIFHSLPDRSGSRRPTVPGVAVTPRFSCRCCSRSRALRRLAIRPG